MKRFVKICLLVCLCLFGTVNVAFAAEANHVVITEQPEDVTVQAGEKATFKVTASGTGLTYTYLVLLQPEHNRRDI